MGTGGGNDGRGLERDRDEVGEEWGDCTDTPAHKPGRNGRI